MNDLNDLYYFAAVVDHGGFAAAERALGIPKSRLSRRISALEDELGVRLLQRSTRRFAVTDVGMSVHRHTQSMLAEAQAVHGFAILIDWHSMPAAAARATEALNHDQARWLVRAESFGTPRSILEQAATNMELAWSMDEHFVNRAKALGERMQALGVIERQPDYAQMFDLRFVRQVRLETDR